MKVIYHNNSTVNECPYLTDGKEYVVEDTIEIDGELFFMIDDDDDEWVSNFEPYRSSLFEIVESENANGLSA